ncbi:MAG: aldose 1-epimerase family protein, partial [Saprospiraceae bacterium]|nr:aldose 1-epimerase family protein [Saprospiraceae bacterium]
EEPPHRIRIRGKVNEVWFNGPNLELWTEISTEPGSSSFRLKDVLTNKSGKEQEFMMLYHVNFGAPLLQKGSRLYGTIQKVVPFDDFAAADSENWNVYGEPINGIAERVFCMYPSADASGKAHFLLQNATGEQGVSFTYAVDQLPYFAQWKNQDSNGYVTGLEPGTGFPHNRSVERKYGRVPVLQPGASRSFQIDYTIHEEASELEVTRHKIEELTSADIEIITEVIAK